MWGEEGATALLFRFCPAKHVCTVAVFAQRGMRTAWGHPKGPILQRNNARKSTKGRSDKVEINQLVGPQGLRFNLRSNKETTSKEREPTLDGKIGFTFYFSVTAILPRVAVLPVPCLSFHAACYLVRGMTPHRELKHLFGSKTSEAGIVSKCFHSHHNAYSLWWMEVHVSAALLAAR